MFGNSLLNIVFCSMIVYLFIIIGLRIFGKNELTQLSVSDLVFVLLISNSVQNAMVGGDNTLLGGIVAAGSLFLLNRGLDLFHYRSPKFAKLMDGEPVVLVRHGKLNHIQMKKNRLTLRDLEVVLRENGIGNIETVDLAILEIDGKISILSDEDIKKDSKLTGEE